MIIVNAKAKTTSENILNLKDVIFNLEQETLKEKGCLDYAFSADINNPNVMRITELWEDLQSLKDHLQTEHVAIFREKMSKKPINVEAHFYESEEMPYPESLS